MQHTINEILPSRNEISHRYRGMSLERVRIMETLITKFVSARRQGRVTHIYSESFVHGKWVMFVVGLYVLLHLLPLLHQIFGQLVINVLEHLHRIWLWLLLCFLKLFHDFLARSLLTTECPIKMGLLKLCTPSMERLTSELNHTAHLFPGLLFSLRPPGTRHQIIAKTTDRMIFLVPKCYFVNCG